MPKIAWVIDHKFIKLLFNRLKIAVFLWSYLDLIPQRKQCVEWLENLHK